MMCLEVLAPLSSQHSTDNVCSLPVAEEAPRAGGEGSPIQLHTVVESISMWLCLLALSRRKAMAKWGIRQRVVLLV